MELIIIIFVPTWVLLMGMMYENYKLKERNRVLTVTLKEFEFRKIMDMRYPFAEKR